MRRCMFCQVELRRGNKAKEHVLRKSWLNKLGNNKLNLPGQMFSIDGYVGDRPHVADQLLCGEVCTQCNNGWMDYLDRSVEHIVIPLAKGEPVIEKLSKDDRKNLGRWLLKTACTFIYSDTAPRRHIPRSILANVRRKNFLPSGFIAFYALSRFPVKAAGAASLDMWGERTDKEKRSFSALTRLKFGVQYDNVMLGCCYVSHPAPSYVGIEGFHVPVISSKARLVTIPSVFYPPFPEGLILPEGLNRAPLNIFLCSMDVQFPLQNEE